MKRLIDERMGVKRVFCKDKKGFCDCGFEYCRKCQFAKGNGVIDGNIAHDVLVTLFGLEYDLDRLRELVEADRDGRCVILRFKPGMFVYRVWPRCDRRKFPFMTSYYLDCKEACIEAQLWNDVYGSEEAARAALNKLKEAEME